VRCLQLRLQRLRRHKWTRVEEPPRRYLFLGAAKEQSWAPVRSTVGVASLVRFGGQVAEVPPKLIEGPRNAAEEPRAARPLFSRAEWCGSSPGTSRTLRPHWI
jgi:transcriptional antiterminator RfaH